MVVVSGGNLILSDSLGGGIWNQWYPASAGVDLTRLFASYGAIYKAQGNVYTVVHKRALATRRLPLKVYLRDEEGRPEQRDSDYARLLRNPNPTHSGSFLWEWTSSTFDLYGEAFWLKIRGRDGQPAELWPIHPTNFNVKRDDEGTIKYVYTLGGMLPTNQPQFTWDAEDVVHFKGYNPDTTLRGLSPCEPLRQTLVNEDAVRRANSALWNNGARPSTWLSHPKTLSQTAMDRLKAGWDAVHSGVDNFAKTAVLEEGMEPHFAPLNLEELQYIEARKLNREEVCMVYDIPPPVVHILDRATFSNITEQMRSMYRDTMAPHLSGLEATMDQQLRPDFDTTGDLYAEFLMDEVLRGSFEEQSASYATAIGTGQMTPAEVRRARNLPFIEGSDVLFRNAALIPVQEPSVREDSGAPIVPLPALGEPKPTDDPVDAATLRSVMGRLGTLKSLTDLDVESLPLNGHRALVQSELDAAIAAGETVDQFRARVRAVLTGDTDAT